VHKVLHYFAQHRDELFKLKQSADAKDGQNKGELK